MPKKIKAIAVYCGSANGHREEYQEAAKTFADCLVKNNISLIYVGAKIGLMGVIADQMMKQNGEVIGIIPDHLAKWEVAHENITQLHVVSSMHERKSLIAKLADAFVMLPGGVGSLDEFFEIFTWARIKLHAKPFGMLNVANYFNHMINFIDHAVLEGFLRSDDRDLMIIENCPYQLLQRFLRN